MNKKGFTLVEILAVIVILGLIMVVVGTKGFGAFDSTKNKIAELNEDAIKEAANVLMMDVENCDDDIDKELYESFKYSNCSELKSEAKNGLDIPLSTLKGLDYISGSDIENIKDDDVSIKAKKDANNKIIVKIIGNIGGSTSSSDTNGKIVYVSNEGDDYNDGTESKPYKTIEQIIEDYPSSDLTINMLTDITMNDIVESDGDITINGNGNILDVYRNVFSANSMVLNDVKVKVNNLGGAIDEVVSLNNSSIIYDFPYSGSVYETEFQKGTYILEVWGADGGNDLSSYNEGGKGGYSYGKLKLNYATTIYIYVGGTSNNEDGGFNGGASVNCGSGGGGATDIRVNYDELLTRIIVAGGGGSGGCEEYVQGGYGGGLEGGAGEFLYGNTYNFIVGAGGTQTRGGTGDVDGCLGVVCIDMPSNGGGAGGGWHAGGNGASGAPGGGGSGYVYTEDTANYYPIADTLSPDYYLTEAYTTTANYAPLSPSPYLASMSKHGYARITQIGL